MAIQQPVDDDRPSMADPNEFAYGEAPLRVERAGSTVLIVIDGDLDATTAPSLVDAADRALEEPCERLLVSCEGLEFVDSTGLSALLAVRAACAGTDTEVHLVHTNPFVEHLLRLVGLDRAFR